MRDVPAPGTMGGSEGRKDQFCLREAGRSHGKGEGLKLVLKDESKFAGWHRGATEGAEAELAIRRKGVHWNGVQQRSKGRLRSGLGPLPGQEARQHPSGGCQPS